MELNNCGDLKFPNESLFLFMILKIEVAQLLNLNNLKKPSPAFKTCLKVAHPTVGFVCTFSLSDHCILKWLTISKPDGRPLQQIKIGIIRRLDSEDN